MSKSTAIPVKNLYYLLSYAWSDKLEESELENIDDLKCPDLASFFAKVLTNRLAPLIRRGLDRAYTTHEELTSQPRGRIDFTASAKRQTWDHGKMHCSYSEFTHDVPHNRILKSTLLLLYRDTTLSTELKKTLHRQFDAFAEVKLVPTTPRSFHRIQLHRNNREYRFLLHLCELIHASLLPEHDNSGRRKFRRIEENKKVMPYIFESFILAFAKKHLTNATSHRPTIKWLADYHKESSANLMPTMNTDVTIEWNTGRKLILDCKYYKNAFSSRTYAEDKEVTRFKTNNLYQIFAYLMNKREDTGWGNVEGMLLYPTTTNDFNESMTLQKKHRLQICSVNLNQPWQDIEAQLTQLLTNLKTEENEI